jgi:hypothetical protein
MSTKYIASNWRLPNEENSGKSDNYGLSFDGSEFINCGSSSALLTTGGLSVSWWMKTTVTANDALVLMDDWSAGNRNWQIAHLSSGNVIRFYVFGSSSAFVLANTSINDGNWHHVVCTYEPSTALRIYIDGSLDNSNTTSIPATRNNSAANLRIGKDDFNQYYTGSISEVAVFDYSLSSTQISTLYGSSSLGAGNPMALKPQPVAYYPLGDNSASNPLTQPNEAVEDASVFDFDGSSNDFISIDENNDKLFQGVNAFTVSAWVKLQAEDGSDQVIVGNDGSTRGFFMGMLNSPVLKFFISTSGSSNDKFTYSNPTTTLNNWVHVVVIWDGTNMDMYVNGMYSKTQACVNATGTFTAPTGTTIGKIGQSSSGVPTYDFDGEISNVQIWYQRLSHGTASVGDVAGGDIATLYNSGVPLLTGTQPQASNLKAWYKLDQSANWEADTSGAWQIPDTVSAYPQSFDFDGSNYITAGDVNIIEQDDNGSLPYSISLWVNIPYSSATQVLLSKQPNSGSYNGFSIYRSNTLINFLLGSGLSPQARIIGSSGFSGYFGTWTNICLTYDGSRDISGFNLYFNKEPKTITTSANQPPQNVLNTADFEIGSRGGGSLKYIGKISNVQVWNTELSSTEVETLYNNGTPLTTAIALDNLKAWYKLDNTATFSTNWSIPDASGNGNTGTSSGMTEQNLVNNNVSVLNGESSGMTSASLVLSDLSKSIPYDSYSFNFDSGSSDYIDCGNNSTFDLNNAFSISTWVKYTSTSAMVVLSKRETTKIGLLIELGSGKPFTAIRDASSNIAITNTYSGTYNDGNWHHIVATFDRTANELKLYVDNELKETANTSSVGDIAPTTNNLMIGRRSDTSSSYFDGKISNVSIFNEELTSTEVMKLYSNGVPQDLSSFSPAPISWWTLGSNSFFNGSNYICRDLIGSNDGTSANAGVDAIVGDSPRSEANGTGTNMDVPTNLEGSTKWSSNNSWSINMSSTARVEDTP